MKGVINLNKPNTCYNCKHYTDSIGENGYCTLYRHNVSTPDVQCSKFENKDKSVGYETELNFRETEQDFHRKIKMDRKKAWKHMLWIASVFSCLVFTVIAIIFAIIAGTAIMSFDTVAITMRIVFIATVCLFLISFLLLSFMLVHRFTVMRIVYICASLGCVAFMLLNESLLWFNFHDLIVGILEEIFNIVF